MYDKKELKQLEEQFRIQIMETLHELKDIKNNIPTWWDYEYDKYAETTARSYLFIMREGLNAAHNLLIGTRQKQPEILFAILVLKRGLENWFEEDPGDEELFETFGNEFTSTPEGKYMADASLAAMEHKYNW